MSESCPLSARSRPKLLTHFGFGAARYCHRVVVGLGAMITRDSEFSLELSRRKLFAAAGIGGVAVAAASFIGTGGAEATPLPSTTHWQNLPSPELHLQFGADAASENRNLE